MGGPTTNHAGNNPPDNDVNMDPNAAPEQEQAQEPELTHHPRNALLET